jgi:nicotinamidase-related amidase
MVSEFRSSGWRPVLAAATRTAPRIAALRRRAHAARVPVVYVNDAAGRWEYDRTALIRRACASSARGGHVVRCIQPAPRDFFLFKPRHSGFYATPLAELLRQLDTRRLILTGLTSHQCVLFTAMDAYVRDFQIVVPPDCIGAPSAVQTRQALFMLRDSLRARTPLSRSIRLR